MTIRAFGRRKIIQEHIFAPDRASLRVALIAEQIGVPSRQWKRSALIVIESGRRPAVGVMTLGAVSRVGLCELPSMNIGVTILANFRRSLEFCRASPRGDDVASTAGDRAVRSGQRKICLAVIEAFCVGPGLHVMACLATQLSAVSGELTHAILEFSMMRIDVARGATPILEMKWQYLIGTASCPLFVTADARHHGVRP